MKSYFHCDANMYRKRVRTFFEYTAAPAVFIAVFLTLCLLLSLRNLMNSGLLLPAAGIIAVVIFAFTLITRIMLEIAEHCIRVHSRYTYIEIGLKDVVVSEYAGSLPQGNGRVPLRKMIVIPLKEFESAEIVGKNRKSRILVKTRSPAIRVYVGKSDRLGYSFKEGDFRFKEYFYQESGYSATGEVFVPRRFKDIRGIVKSIYVAKENFDNLPPPKPYVFKESAFIQAKKNREKIRRLRGF